jgi:hypothetical protein
VRFDLQSHQSHISRLRQRRAICVFRSSHLRRRATAALHPVQSGFRETMGAAMPVPIRSLRQRRTTAPRNLRWRSTDRWCRCHREGGCDPQPNWSGSTAESRRRSNSNPVRLLSAHFLTASALRWTLTRRKSRCLDLGAADQVSLGSRMARMRTCCPSGPLTEAACTSRRTAPVAWTSTRRQ